MHRLTSRILDVNNTLQNKNVPINKRFCVIPPPYYLDWFEKSYPNVTINQDEFTIFLQLMNGIQGTKPSGRQWN